MVEAIEPYPSEMPKIKKAFARLQREFANTPLTSTSQRHFELAARNLFGEAGFEIWLEWKELADMDNNQLGISVPSLTLSGRVKKESETDHEKMKWDITKGLADGKPGFIREDGKLHEEPRKKDIY
jgi:hypothetical protein